MTSDQSYGTLSTIGESISSWGSLLSTRPDPKYYAKAFAPLIRHLEQYDRLRSKYETDGMRLSELEAVTKHLHEKIVVTSHGGRKFNVVLTNPGSIRDALNEIGDYDLHLSVRVRESKMPVYYFCRTRSSYWTDYTLILEDFYLSPGYPILDERFVQLMRYGHETFHLRLSTLRKTTAALEKEGGELLLEDVDRILRHVGEVVFQSAWHEDQRLAFACAEAFQIPKFRQAVELLYLCLCGDLCSLRNTVDRELTTFFQKAYEQPAIARFLKILPSLEGGELNRLSERALKAYAELSASFSKLLHVQVVWGRTGARMPIFKLVFANTTRVNLVGDALKDEPTARAAARELNVKAGTLIAEITNYPDA